MSNLSKSSQAWKVKLYKTVDIHVYFVLFINLFIHVTLSTWGIVSSYIQFIYAHIVQDSAIRFKPYKNSDLAWGTVNSAKSHWDVDFCEYRNDVCLQK